MEEGGWIGRRVLEYIERSTRDSASPVQPIHARDVEAARAEILVAE